MIIELELGHSDSYASSSLTTGLRVVKADSGPFIISIDLNLSRDKSGLVRTLQNRTFST